MVAGGVSAARSWMGVAAVAGPTPYSAVIAAQYLVSPILFTKSVSAATVVGSSPAKNTGTIFGEASTGPPWDWTWGGVGGASAGYTSEGAVSAVPASFVGGATFVSAPASEPAGAAGASEPPQPTPANPTVAAATTAATKRVDPTRISSEKGMG